MNRKAASRLPDKGGYSFYAAPNGKVVLDPYERNECDAVLVDRRMQEMDGLKKQERRKEGSPTIAATAGAVWEERE